MKKLVTLVLSLMVAITYAQHAGQKPQDHKIVVKEVIQVTGYTYLKATENSDTVWLAVPTMNANVGETYYYNDPMPMTNFTSKELGRTFPQIYFLAALKSDDEKTAIVQDAHAQRKPDVKENVLISHSEGVVTIAELHANKEKYADKTIRIQGKVTKFTTKILYTNWAHIQDGTSQNENFDLTVTTKEELKLGEEVIFEGKIVLNKDYGYGYFFSVIMTDAVVIKK